MNSNLDFHLDIHLDIQLAIKYYIIMYKPAANFPDELYNLRKDKLLLDK